MGGETKKGFHWMLRLLPVLLAGYLFFLFAVTGFSRFGAPPISYIISKMLVFVLIFSAIGMVFLNKIAWFVWVIVLPLFSAAWLIDVDIAGGQIELLCALIFPIGFWIGLLMSSNRKLYK